MVGIPGVCDEGIIMPTTTAGMAGYCLVQTDSNTSTMWLELSFRNQAED